MLHLDRLHEEIAALSRHTVARRAAGAVELDTLRRWWAELPDAATVRAQMLPLAAKFAAVLALPAEATLDKVEAPAGAPPPGSVIIGVDGSQIYPDRHAAAIYYAIQIGALVFRYTGATPTPLARASLHFAENELYEGGQLISATRVGMRRTVAEIEKLAQWVALERGDGAAPPILTLSDGPLLWVSSERQSREESEARRRYLEALQRIEAAGGAPAGFVERPAGRFWVDLWWAAQLPPETLLEEFPNHPLRTLDDHLLMQAWLAPGERSAWLERCSETNTLHAEMGQRIWFCYVNVGAPGYPVIARVEVPEWLAQRRPWSELLHATLVHQAGLLQGNPYVLARAHEEALLTVQDKAILDDFIQRELLAQGLVAQPSQKAQQKTYLGSQRNR